MFASKMISAFVLGIFLCLFCIGCGGDSDGGIDGGGGSNIDITGTWTYKAEIEGCSSIESGTYTWTYGNGQYDLAVFVEYGVNPNTCAISLMNQTCDDEGFPASNPISKNEFLSGMNDFYCSDGFVDYDIVEFVNSDKIIMDAHFTGTDLNLTITLEREPTGDATNTQDDLYVSASTWNVTGRYATCGASGTAEGTVLFLSSGSLLTSYSYTGEDWHHDCTVDYIGNVDDDISSLGLSEPLSANEVESLCDEFMPGFDVTVSGVSSTSFTCSYYDSYDGSTEIVTFTK